MALDETLEKISLDERASEAILNEMGVMNISSNRDGLPFRISVLNPDKGGQDHAHILKKDTKFDELGTFVVTKNPPKSPTDLIEYKAGKHKGLKDITESQRQAISDWANRPNWAFPGTNWQALQYQCTVNRN